VPRRQRTSVAGLVCHVLNRATGRLQLFDDALDYAAFLRVLAETQQQTRMRILAYCVMPNHFHLIVWPETHVQLARFMHRLTLTHAKRWHACRGTHGYGALYQGRYKAFAVQTERYFLAVCRYVERNPLRARLVARAEDWPWSSLAQRCRNGNVVTLYPWPVPTPADWRDRVNASEVDADLNALRRRLRIDAPYGDDNWCQTIRNRV
jgi:putative transposase